MERNSYTILLVDDNFDNVELLAEMLQAQGYCTLNALNGHDAIKMAANEHPDLILLDIAMPVMDGLEVLDVLKSDGATAKIPVMFVTGIMQNKQIARALERDVVDYIAKPFAIPDVIEKIDRYLKRSSGKKI